MVGGFDMQGLNVIWVFSPDCDKVLMCKRHKEPYKGLYNLVGWKIEPNEKGVTAAYREFAEETGITDITLRYLMDFTYYSHDYNQLFASEDVRVEVYFGKLNCAQDVSGDEKELVWLDITENFLIWHASPARATSGIFMKLSSKIWGCCNEQIFWIRQNRTRPFA